MVKAKTSKSASTHDRKVRQIARDLEKQGYTVRADIRGKGRPNPIGAKKLVPDIEATKRGQRRIIEVETPTSLKTDKEQIKTFARHAGQQKNTRFDLVITKPRAK